MFHDERAKKIVLLTYYYSPGIKAGGFRAINLSKSLAKTNQVTVITAERGFDNSYTRSRNLRVIRVRMWPRIPISTNNLVMRKIRLLWNKLSMPDSFIGWILFAIWAILKVNRQEGVDVIIATGPPFSTMIAPYFVNIAKKIPYIMDYRDPWTMYEWKLLYDVKKYKRIESAIIKRASLIVKVTEEMGSAFIREANYDKAVEIITNGYSELMYSCKPKELKNKIRIVYAGNYYGGRTVAPLINPLKRLARDRGFAFEFITYGKFTLEDKERITKAGMNGVFFEHRQVSKEVMMKELLDGDILYIHSGDGYEYAIPFKIYDYIAAQRPILAIAGNTEAIGRIVRDHKLGECVINNESAIYNAILQIIETQYEPKRIQKYLWSEITLEYEKAIDKVIGT